jgi:hypothetical protein
LSGATASCIDSGAAVMAFLHIKCATNVSIPIRFYRFVHSPIEFSIDAAVVSIYRGFIRVFLGIEKGTEMGEELKTGLRSFHY